jgi:hypothetical protein
VCGCAGDCNVWIIILYYLCHENTLLVFACNLIVPEYCAMECYYLIVVIDTVVTSH